MSLRSFIVLCAMAITLLTACTPQQPKVSTAGSQIHSSLANAIAGDEQIATTHQYTSGSPGVNAALLPPLSIQLPNASAATPEKRFDVAVKNMPAREFFMGLVAGTKYNMLVDPDVSGDISLSLKDVTIDNVLDAARQLYGYEYHQTQYGFEILSQEMRTEIFSINYLNIDRSGQSRTQLTSTSITDSMNPGGGSSGGNSSQPAASPSTPG